MNDEELKKSEELKSNEEELKKSEEETRASEDEEKMYQLDLAIEELNVELENLEIKLEKNPDDPGLCAEYEDLKARYKEKFRERKIFRKEADRKASAINQISLWIVVYGVVMIVISFPLVAGSLWYEFTKFLVGIFGSSISDIHTAGWVLQIVVFLIIFALPLLLNLLTWILHNNCLKSKIDKKTFSVFWGIQGIMQLAMIIYMCVKIYG